MKKSLNNVFSIEATPLFSSCPGETGVASDSRFSNGENEPDKGKPRAEIGVS
jgi:hypothetical protein